VLRQIVRPIPTVLQRNLYADILAQLRGGQQALFEGCLTRSWDTGFKLCQALRRERVLDIPGCGSILPVIERASLDTHKCEEVLHNLKMKGLAGGPALVAFPFTESIEHIVPEIPADLLKGRG
jgi:hypothetical protein